MGYEAPTWQNGGPPALNAKNMQDISDNLAYVSNNMVNPYLLDNWYWGNPVNQRGQTSYTGAGYTIDRWRIDDSNGLGYFTINSDKTITISNGAAQNPLWFTQILENVIPGTRTASALVTAITGTANMYSGASTGMGLLLGLNAMQSSEEDNIGMRIVVFPNSSVTLKAVGLELGSQQTLAHQENGEWVLNEIPKFGDQLAECQRYALELNPLLIDYFTAALGVGWDNAGEVDFAIPVPVTMRANPVAVNAANWKAVDTTDGSFHTINAMELYSGSGVIKVVCHIDSSLRGRTYALMCDNVNKSLFVSADL